VFTEHEKLFDAVSEVIRKIDDGMYNDFGHVQWWNDGIQWETILPTIFKGE